jgi:uncharacterized protein YndB with AHSA1/START domain
MNAETVAPKQRGQELDPIKGYELKITRVFDAPREVVWKAWTDPKIQMQWMGPRGFTTTELDMPITPGARWRRTMEGLVPATGQSVTLKQHGTIREVKPPELFVFSFAWDVPSDVGLSNMDLEENIVTVRLEERGNKTVMTFTQGPFLSASACDGHTGGWNSAFDKFMEFLDASQPPRPPDPDRVPDSVSNEVPTELHLRRFFKAPRDLVFAAWTNPEMLAQWWAPKGFTIPRCEFEAKGGGNIYIEMKAPDGTVYPMSGRVVEFFPPYRFHFTAKALDVSGNAIFENWNSVFLEEKNGGTELTLDVHVMSMTDAAPMYLKGMKQGWSQSLEKLEQFLMTQ